MGKREGDYLILDEFPNSAKAPFLITSLETDSYNCVAWALSESQVWYEPEEDYSLSGVIAFFESYNFEICSSADDEEGFEKIALYSEDGEEFTHVARLLVGKEWTSKLGFSYDVTHSLETLEGGFYGKAYIYMKRNR